MPETHPAPLSAVGVASGNLASAIDARTHYERQSKTIFGPVGGTLATFTGIAFCTGIAVFADGIRNLIPGATGIILALVALVLSAVVAIKLCHHAWVVLDQWRTAQQVLVAERLRFAWSQWAVEENFDDVEVQDYGQGTYPVARHHGKRLSVSDAAGLRMVIKQ